MTVLLCDDEEEIRIAFAQSLEIEGLNVKTYARANRIIEAISPEFDGVIISDIRMPQMDGIELQNAVHNIDPEIPLILITGNGDVDTAVRGMKAGAYDFLTKPVSPAHLVKITKHAIERRRLVLENRVLRAQIMPEQNNHELIGECPEIQSLRKNLNKIAQGDMPVLIEGETGTGKNVLAHMIHTHSKRADKAFIVVPMTALPRQNIESELFGHIAGAFNGIARTRIGRLEHAREGTIVLDEIGALPLDIQMKLLRVIEDNAITPMGSNDPITINARFIATTKENLEARVAEGLFRDDLYYRLNAVKLFMPSLRARRGDIPQLFHHFVRIISQQLDMPLRDISPDDLMALSLQNWPGNVRQLRYAAEGFVHNLDVYPRENIKGGLVEILAEFEKNIITASLSAHGGNLKEVYESLSISRKSLYEKIQKYGITRD